MKQVPLKSVFSNIGQKQILVRQKARRTPFHPESINYEKTSLGNTDVCRITHTHAGMVKLSLNMSSVILKILFLFLIIILFLKCTVSDI